VPRLTTRICCTVFLLGVTSTIRAAELPAWPHPGQDQPTLELVMKIVVTCSSPEPVAPETSSKDGKRSEIWPIIGGRFFGKDIRGTVVPGGGDFPVQRPDGVEVIDALYRLKTDDGVTIIIHNKGLVYPADKPEDARFRLVPEFIAPQGRYDWLNRNVFVSTLVFPAPSALAQAEGPNQNDRVIEVYRVF
jgi:Protein of unknown function (DUF3237)